MTKQIFTLAALVLVVALGIRFYAGDPPAPLLHISQEPSAPGDDLWVALDNGRWIRSFQAADGTLYFHGGIQSLDGGKTFRHNQTPELDSVTATPERAVLAKPGLFYALDGPVHLVEPGSYLVDGWTSKDDLKTVRKIQVRVNVPDGPREKRPDKGWFGLYVYRTIVDMEDGRWLLTMYGNFSKDRLTPPDHSSRKEVKYMMRSLVLESRDQGRSWDYLATIAAPREGDPLGEGFVEPALTRLQDGRLLCVMRTGHHFPLYASWSEDGGKSWSDPVYTGLDRGCDPCLLTLKDGRIALTWGHRFPAGWSRISAKSDAERFSYPGKGIVYLSLSNDQGETWATAPLGKDMGSCYSTLFEVTPGVLLVQVDQWVRRIVLSVTWGER